MMAGFQGAPEASRPWFFTFSGPPFLEIATKKFWYNLGRKGGKSVNALLSALDGAARAGSGLQGWLGVEWLGVALWQYVLALLMLLLALFARRAARFVAERFALPLLDRAGGVYTKRLVAALTRPLSAFISVTGVYLAARAVLIAEEAAVRSLVSVAFVDRAFHVAAAAVVIWAAVRSIDVAAQYVRSRAEEEELPLQVPVISLLSTLVKVFVGVTGGILVVQEMGYPIASLLGGLGLGGLAVALAAQDTLANVFGSMIVFADKPFKVGDWVKIGDVEGHVESIGLRSTRIRTWPKSLVTVPNKVIAGAQIENWSAMPKRRVRFVLRVAFGATPGQMEALVEGVREILRAHPGVDQEFFLVNFTDFGTDGLELLVYYFTVSTVWREHLQVREEVNLEIMRLMERLGLTLGMPSRRIYGP